MMLSRFALAALTAACLVVPGRAQDSRPAEMTGLQVMQKSESLNRAKDEVTEATMKISERKTVLKERSLTMTMKSGEKYEDRSLIRFSSGDVRGTGFLTHQHGAREDDQWIYLPATRKIKRLAAAERKESFVGSDFAYEDLRTENLDAHSYKVLEKRMVKAVGANCYLVEARAASEDEKASTGYSKRILWVSEGDFLVRRIDYYSKDGEEKGILKTQIFHDFTSPAEYKGFKRPARCEMMNNKTKTVTEMIFNKRTIEGGVKDEDLTERQLAQ
jgi:hypothetical protein